MMIRSINRYQVEIDGRKGILEFSGTRKQLEEFIKEDLLLSERFKPMRMQNNIRKDGYYFRFIDIEY